MTRPRRTLQSPTARLDGVGLHSGADVFARIFPAASGRGLIFRDTTSGQEIPARAANVVETTRCTRLGSGGVTVQTVEHLLSALSAMGIDDALIETGGGEIPAMDGSASPFVEALRAAGLRDQEDSPPVTPLTFRKPEMATGERGESLVIMPAETFRLTAVLHYPNAVVLGTQAMTFDFANGDYAREIAPARTFGFLSEYENLRAQGLAGGASYENTLVLRDTGYDSEHLPRFLDEPVRHKLLDLIGDLALIGQPLQAHVIAIKPSHALNVRLAQLCS